MAARGHHPGCGGDAMQNDIGTMEAGKYAEIIAVQGNTL
jgi:hypothetical protein